MILQRVTKATKEQDWFTVFLEVLIVVIGIFIGLQVDGWATARKLQIDEKATLIRLQAESESVVTYWQEQVYASGLATTNRRKFLKFLHAGEVEVAQQSVVDDALMRLTHYPANSPPSSVYDELIGSGGLRSISNVAARDAVADYARELAFIDGQLIQFRTALPVIARAFDGRIRSIYAPEEASLRRYGYDISALSVDEEFKSHMVDSVRDQLQFHSYRLRVLRSATQMCISVSRAASKSCDFEELDLEKIIEWDGVNQ